jgi:hypothetical protein
VHEEDVLVPSQTRRATKVKIALDAETNLAAIGTASFYLKRSFFSVTELELSETLLLRVRAGHARRVCRDMSPRDATPYKLMPENTKTARA